MTCTHSVARSSTQSLPPLLRALAAELQRQKQRSAEACYAALLLASCSVYAVGCQRVVLVTESSPMRMGSDCRARVYTLGADGGWTLSDNAVTLPEGWYLVPPSFVADADSGKK